MHLCFQLHLRAGEHNFSLPGTSCLQTIQGIPFSCRRWVRIELLLRSSAQPLEKDDDSFESWAQALPLWICTDVYWWFASIPVTVLHNFILGVLFLYMCRCSLTKCRYFCKSLSHVQYDAHSCSHFFRFAKGAAEVWPFCIHSYE